MRGAATSPPLSVAWGRLDVETPTCTPEPGRWVWRPRTASAPSAAAPRAVRRVRALGSRDSYLHTVVVSVGFADIVSFTHLSNGIDEDRIADLVEHLESACADLVTAGGGAAA